MADTVDTDTLITGGRRHIVHLTNISDGTGESAVVKVDISALSVFGRTPTYSAVEQIEFSIQGFSSVRLHWDHTTDDLIAVLPSGNGCIQFWETGGKTDPRSTGGTGDVLLTTNGGASGSTYDIKITMRLKA